MNKMEYESPRFVFQELQLMERVADRCWGCKYAWYDADSDGVIDDTEMHYPSGDKKNGCGPLSQALEVLLASQGIEEDIIKESTSTSTKAGGIIVPVYS